MRILVLGGTGYVGGHLIPRLINEGHDVRCLIRNPAKKSIGSIVTIHGDATDAAVVKEAVSGCDRLVYLIHSMSGQSAGFEELDRRIAINVANAAKQASIQQIVYLGGLGNKATAPSPHLRSRHEVASILRSSGLPVTELRAAVIIGAGSASFEMIRYLVARLPVMICPKWVNRKTQPISIGDVLEYLTRSINMSQPESRTLDIGGPDILSYRDMMLAVARLMNRRRLIIPVPVLTPWLSSHWVNLVTPLAAPLAMTLIESVRNETVCENQDALRLFDLKPIGFEEAVKRALSENRPHIIGHGPV